jgi:hypothetical protein
MQHSLETTEAWTCPGCGADKTRIASIDMYLLDDDSILSHIRCRDCHDDDHTARLHMRLSFDEEEGA